MDRWVDDRADLLRDISTGLKWISAAAGLLSFIPVLAPIFPPIALAAGGAALAMDGLLAASGHGSWRSFAVDAALMALPGAGKLASKAVTARHGARVSGALSEARLGAGADDTSAAASALKAADVAPDPLKRRVTLRTGTKARIRADSLKTADGDFIDPNTGMIIPKDGPFDYGHKPGFEWWRTKEQARSEGWTRKQVIEYENDPTHYQVESPNTNRSHRFESPKEFSSQP